jgi:hypothetical protein
MGFDILGSIMHQQVAHDQNLITSSGSAWDHRMLLC